MWLVNQERIFFTKQKASAIFLKNFLGERLTEAEKMCYNQST